MPFWYLPTRWWAWLLYPLSLLLRLISSIRRFVYQKGWLKSYQAAVPVVVVGNISVGGNGKTPFAISLCELLIAEGFKPGVVSRGYGGKAESYPLLVTEHTTGKQAGDEPVLIYKRLGIPVVVDPKRSDAAKFLTEQCDIDVIISDDGLQHYALQRDIEIVVVDGKRRYGNQHIMPMGPLREPVSRLKTVDYIINNGYEQHGEHTMLLQPTACQRVDGQPGQLTLGEVNACAAIGHPPRFFETLAKLGFQLKQALPFPDHHAYSEADFERFDEQVDLVMTEKDAVKCTHFAKQNWWFLPIDAQLPVQFTQPFLTQLKQIKDRKC